MIMDAALREKVWRRAGGVCEYCRLAQELDAFPFQIDHVIAAKHHGPDTAENLALSCYNCNIHKGPNIAGVDPDSGQITRLFNPRQDDWSEHFAWNGAELRGQTPIGRVTVDVLGINLGDRLEHRKTLSTAGLFPDRS